MLPWCVILNPKAGSAEDIPAIRQSLQRLQPVRLFETRKAGDATRYARQALREGITGIAAAGGDGTLNEVLNALAPDFDDCCLGVLPVGTGNDFCRTVDVPPNLDEAIDLLCKEQTRMLDVVRLETAAGVRYFINSSAGGFSGVVDEKLTAASKEWWGHLAYYFSAAKALPELQEYNSRIWIDGEGPEPVSFYNIVVANGRCIAGGIPIAPAAKPDDGLIDVVIVPSMPVVELAMILPKILSGAHTSHPDLIIRQARQVRVESEPGFSLNADGELAGDTPAAYRVIPRAVRVVTG